jgi:hypothetical protein
VGKASRRKRDPGSQWQPPQGRIQSAAFFPGTPEEKERQEQDFLAGTVFAEGAGVLYPTGPVTPGDPPPGFGPLFTVFLQDAAATWEPAPVLRELLALVDAHGGVELHERLTVATSWAVLDDPSRPLAKLKLDVTEPVKGSARIILLAANYAGHWRHVVCGGMIAITTQDRVRNATAAPGATFADGMNACLLAGIGTSPGIDLLMTNHGWPR